METEELVRIGRVVKPHGVTGELVVEAEGDSLPALTAGSPVWTDPAAAPVELSGIRPHAGRWLVRLVGTADRDAAERLRGAWIAVPAAALAAAGADEAYVDDLVGCEFRTPEGGRIGQIVGVVPGASHDMLEVDTGDDVQLVPMVAEWLESLDITGRVVVMRLPEGLL